MYNMMRSDLADKRATLQSSRSGFTLVELLVVIAIIMLLVSLVSPSIMGALEQAKSIACVNNQRAIGVGSVLYASSNKQMLYTNMTVEVPFRQYQAAGGKNIYVRNVTGYGSEGIYGMGVLYRDGYVKDAKQFYCPAREGRATDNIVPLYFGRVGNGPIDWRTIIGNKSRARAGYYYNLYRIERVDNPKTGLAGTKPESQKVLDRVGTGILPASKQVLSMDVLRNSNANPTMEMVYHRNGVVNMGFLDGSVRSLDSRKAQMRYQTDSASSGIDSDYDFVDILIDDLVGTTTN